jgi:hypothetical protein
MVLLGIILTPSTMPSDDRSDFSYSNSDENCKYAWQVIRDFNLDSEEFWAILAAGLSGYVSVDIFRDQVQGVLEIMNCSKPMLVDGHSVTNDPLADLDEDDPTS